MSRLAPLGFEPLDEPDASAGRIGLRSVRWEMLLGLLLVLGLLGWGAADWWKNQNALANYQRAERYTIENEWEMARAAYLSAGDYADAEDRAATAAQRSAQRDSGYASAVAALKAGDWLPALRDLRTVRAIQPGYREVDALYSRAEATVYTAALSSTVAMRTAANPPGLYLRAADGWRWLEGSDQYSQVRGALCTYGYVLYDTPTPAGEQVIRNPSVPAPPGNDGIPRRIVAARLLDGRLQGVPLDFGAIGSDVILCGKSGVLGVRRHPEIPPPSGTPLGLGRNVEYFYQSLSDIQAHAVTLPPGASLSSLQLEHDLLLVSRTRASPPYGESQTDYYAVDLLKDAATLLYTGQGNPLMAELSSDGRQLLALQHTGVFDKLDGQALLLIDLADGGVTTLSTWLAPSPTPARSWSSFGLFIPTGPLAGRVLTVSNSPDRSTLGLTENLPPRRTVWTGDGGQGRVLNNVVPFERGVFFSWDEGGCADSVPFITYVDPFYRSTQVDLGIAPGQRLYQAVVSGQYLVILAGDDCTSGIRTSYRIGTIRLDDLTRPGAKPHEIFSTTLTGIDTLARTWHIGNNVLAHVEPDGLHVSSLDGNLDLAIEPGITDLYQISR